jgi:hypothetical protein
MKATSRPTVTPLCGFERAPGPVDQHDADGQGAHAVHDRVQAGVPPVRAAVGVGVFEVQRAEVAAGFLFGPVELEERHAVHALGEEAVEFAQALPG